MYMYTCKSCFSIGGEARVYSNLTTVYFCRYATFLRFIQTMVEGLPNCWSSIEPL